MTKSRDREALDALQGSLEALRESLERSTGSAERMVEESERYCRVRRNCAERQERLAALALRIHALREAIEWRTQTLDVLRRRMHRLRGSYRPH